MTVSTNEQLPVTQQDPILLFGLPRSGTTWLGKIFDSHPSTFYLHEPDKAVRAKRLPTCLSYPVDEVTLNDLLSQTSTWLSSRKASVVTRLPFFPKNYDSYSGRKLRYATYAFGKLVSRVLGDTSLPNFIVPDGLQSRLVWKSVNSSGYLGVLARAMPQAKALLILRHPCGEIASVLRRERNHKNNMPAASADMGIFEALSETAIGKEYKFTMELAQSLTPEERLAWRWKIQNDHAVRQISDLKNARVILYEDVCKNPVKYCKDLFSFCGLSWSAQTESFIGRSTESKSTDSSYFSINKDPKLAATKWMDELSKDEIARIEAVLSDSPAYEKYSRSNTFERSKAA